VTEIGEKEKMKSKILATLVVLVLVCGIFAAAINIGPVEAVAPPYYLTIATSPYPSIPTIPAPGIYEYNNIAWQNCTAPAEFIVGTTKYVFKNWTVTPLTDDIFNVGGDPKVVWVHMDGVYQNKTATAYYNTQYKVTLDSNPFTALGATDYIWSTDTGWVLTNSLWVDAGDQAKVGVDGLSIMVGPKPGVWTDIWNRWAFCDSFDKDFTGYHNDAVSAWSDPLTVNGPKTGSSVWAFYYALYVSSNPNPPVPNPPGQNYYPAGQVVSLNAPEYNPGGGRRWILNYWTLDGVMKDGNPLNVTMDWNHTAIAYYKRQSFVYLRDNIGNFSGIEDNGKWYDDGVPYTFTAPTPLSVGPGVQYDFRFWDKPGYAWTSTDNPVTITFDASWDGEKLRARYQTQYYLVVQSSGSGPVPGFLYPDSATTGWYDAWSWVSLKARPIVQINPTKRFEFQQWKNQLGGTSPYNNITFQMTQPWTLTAEYQLEWLATWKHSPSTISVLGSPGQQWFADGYDLWYSLPGTDVSGNFVFYYWVVNGTTFAQGVNTVHVGIMKMAIDGTAYYANKTKLFIDPSYHEETAHAYCNKFNVTIYASNFDANRLAPNAMDIYGFDIIIGFPANLIEVQDVYTNLANFFAPNDYFPKPNGMIKIDNVAGTFQIVATVKGNFTGFSGTKWIFKLTFHVKYDPCYPNYEQGGIYFIKAKLVNHLDQEISPELWGNSWYFIGTVKPWLEVRNAVDKTNLVKVDKNVPQTFFDVEVYLNKGVKVSDFYVIVSFNKDQIMAVSVTIADYLKPPFAIYHKDIDNVNGYVTVYVAQEAQVPYQNCSGLLFTIRFKVVNQIWYRIPGPFTLESDIAIYYAELSVHCPGLFYQTTTNGWLGSKSCHYVYNPLPGDLDYDGWVTVLDLQLILDHYCNNWPAGYDVTGDGHTDIMDLVFVALRFNNHI